MAKPTHAPPPILHGTAHDRATAIVERCGGGIERAKGWMVCCPAHQDHTPSLSITPKEGMVLLHCFTGCTTAAILDALNLSWQDLFEEDDWKGSGMPKPGRPKSRRMPPPGPAEPLALAFAVDLVMDDVEMLTVEGVVDILRLATTAPLQWLWVERAFQAAGMTPRSVWQVLYPHAEEPYVYAGSRDIPLTYEQRIAARLRRAGYGR